MIDAHRAAVYHSLLRSPVVAPRHCSRLFEHAYTLPLEILDACESLSMPLYNLNSAMLSLVQPRSISCVNTSFTSTICAHRSSTKSDQFQACPPTVLLCWVSFDINASLRGRGSCDPFLSSRGQSRVQLMFIYLFLTT